MPKVALRDYQVEMVENILRAFERRRSVMCQMPTGTGKTEVFCVIIKHFLECYPNRGILVMVHRVELLRQIRERLLLKFNIPSGAIASTLDCDFNHRVQVGMVMSIDQRDNNPRRSLIVIDEAHHARAATYTKLVNKYMADQETKLLGVTATPARLDGKSLSDLFSRLILSKSIGWFTKYGYLSKIKYYGIGRVPLGRLAYSKFGDFEEDSASELMQSERILADTLESYLKFARGKKTLIFCVNLSHAYAVRDTFQEEGIQSQIIDSTTIYDDRLARVRIFQDMPGGIMINVGIFTEGFDCPDIEVVILARPTQSVTLFLQMVGRVTRTAPGKPFGMILDNAGNYLIHGLPTKVFDWTNMFYNERGLRNRELTELLREGSQLKARKPPMETPGLEMYELIDETDEISYLYEGDRSELIDWPLSIDLPNSMYDPFRPTNRGAYYFPNHVCACGTYVHRFQNSNGENKMFDSMLPEVKIHTCHKEQIDSSQSIKAFPASLQGSPESESLYILTMMDFIRPQIRCMIYEEIPSGSVNGECPIIARRIDEKSIEIIIYDLNKKRKYKPKVTVRDYDQIDPLFSKVPDFKKPKTEKKKRIVHKEFDSIKIGSQTWMARNLSVDQFRNGEKIMHVKSVSEWQKASDSGVPACCYYDNDSDHDEPFGMLYNWHAVIDKRGLAPEGWRIPTILEWVELINKFGGSRDAGRILKCTTKWESTRSTLEKATDTYGFSALPGGCRSINGLFSSMGTFGNWWTKSSYDNKTAKAIGLINQNHTVDYFDEQKGFGLSVRCLKGDW